MSILRASLLFSRANSLYSQLQFINSKVTSKDFRRMLEQMDIIYGSENTRANRDKLQEFINQHGDEIQSKANELNHDNFWKE